MGLAKQIIETVESITERYGVGTRVKITGGTMKQFHGQTGEVIGHEKDGRTIMHRVKLDSPVEIPGVGKVKDDLWSPEYLKRHGKG